MRSVSDCSESIDGMPIFMSGLRSLSVRTFLSRVTSHTDIWLSDASTFQPTPRSQPVKNGGMLPAPIWIWPAMKPSRTAAVLLSTAQLTFVCGNCFSSSRWSRMTIRLL